VKAPGNARTALLGGNVLWLSLVSLLNDAASEMIYPLLPLFLVGTLGASTTMLGAIEGAAESASSLLKLASGWLSDRMRRRKPLILWGYAIATFARPLVGLASTAGQVLAIRFSDRVGKGMRSAPRDALLAGSVPPTHRGRAFGLHRAADHTGAVIGPLIASALLLVIIDLRIIFALAVVPGLIALVVIVTRVREYGPAPVDATAPQLEQAASSLRRPFVLFLMSVFVFTLGNATDAFLLLRAADLGVPVAAVPLLWAAHHVSKVVWSVPGGALADRFGARRAIIAGWCAYAATYAGFAVATTPLHVWSLFLLYGLFYGLTEGPEKALVAGLAQAGTRGGAFGAYHFVVGIGALPASILFGALWHRYGAPTAFLTGAGLAGGAAAFLLLGSPRSVAPAR
jgi:MFS family permease